MVTVLLEYIELIKNYYAGIMLGIPILRLTPYASIILQTNNY